MHITDQNFFDDLMTETPRGEQEWRDYLANLNYQEAEERTFRIEQESLEFGEQQQLLFERETAYFEWEHTGGTGDQVEADFWLERVRSSRHRLEVYRRQILDSIDLFEELVRERIRQQQDRLESHNQGVHSERQGGSWTQFFLRNIVELQDQRRAIVGELEQWEDLLRRVLAAKRVIRRP